MKITGVLDLEAANWTRIIVAAVYSPDDGARTFRALSELVEYLLARGGTWWSWAGGHYDMLAILAELHARGIRCAVNRAGSRVTSIVCGKLKLCDAYAICPMPLDTACDIAGRPPVGGIGWRCICGDQCGGYCQISRSMPLDMRAQLAAYCVADCEAGYAVLVALRDIAQGAGLELRGTVGGTAWASAQAALGLPDAEWFHGTWRRAARGYYGGRLYVGRAWAEGGQHWDVASAYPAALARTALPVGPACELGGARAGIAYGNGIPGIYRVTVDVPAMEIPPLPWRSRSGRLAWPWGLLRGSWTAGELAAAESRGASIQAHHGAVVWPDGEAPLFPELIADWYGRRAAAGPSSGEGRWWRELMNSLTGKLAQRPDLESVVCNPDMSRLVICDGRGKASRSGGCSIDECTGRCGAWSQLDPWGAIWAIPAWRLPDSAHVGWAAYLTSAMRVAWLDAADAIGADRIVYGATDSIRALDGAPPPGAMSEDSDAPAELGQWAPKEHWAEWTCLGPGRYRYVDGDTGEIVCRVTGASRVTDREWQAMREHDQAIIDTRGVATFGEAVGTGNLWQRRTRSTRVTVDSAWRGDRILALSDGRTYPASREQINARDEARSRNPAQPRP